MSESKKSDLFPYYETELRFMREMAKEFAGSHKEAARRLLIEGDSCADPHVERLIQSFALIAGRIRHKLDDEFPEITEALLGILYPHYVRPIPAMAIAQFQLAAAQGKVTSGRTLRRRLPVWSKAVDSTGEPCRFRTAYPVTLWPLRVESAKVLSPRSLPAQVESDVTAAIQLTIQCEGASMPASMGLTNLRFYLNGEGQLPFTLYELLLNNVRGVQLSSDSDGGTVTPVVFPGGAIQPVGFDREDALLDYPDRSFVGYQLLSEFFAFPQKFLFFDLVGFDKLQLAQLGQRFEITFLLGPFERSNRLRNLEKLVRADNFQLGCTPMVNLFSRPAEPLSVTHTQTEYRVVPNKFSPMSTEVYSVDTVVSASIDPEHATQVRSYQPFYGFRHNYHGDAPKQFWYASRQKSSKKTPDGRDDSGTDVYLSLVDQDFKPARAEDETLSVHVTCTNRDLPATLDIPHNFGDLLLDEGANLRARCAFGPTEAIRPNLRSGLQWRLISHLALNYLSLADANAASLREILKLYNFADDPVKRDQIGSVIAVTSEPHMTRLRTTAGVNFALGLKIRIDFNEDQLPNSEVFLFASVLERFLGLYSAANSFTQLEVFTSQRKEALRLWPARAGEQILV